MRTSTDQDCLQETGLYGSMLLISHACDLQSSCTQLTQLWQCFAVLMLFLCVKIAKETFVKECRPEIQCSLHVFSPKEVRGLEKCNFFWTNDS